MLMQECLQLIYIRLIEDFYYDLIKNGILMK